MAEPKSERSRRAREKRRAELKAAFMEGFELARRPTADEAWERSDTRRLFDYGPLKEPSHG